MSLRVSKAKFFSHTKGKSHIPRTLRPVQAPPRSLLWNMGLSLFLYEITYFTYSLYVILGLSIPEFVILSVFFL